MRLLQIGLGNFGMSWFQDILCNTEEIEMIFVCEKDETRMNMGKEIAKEQDKPCIFFYNLSQALISPVDFIINVSPPHLHKRTTLMCLKNGAPVLLEKPIALNKEDAQIIYQASRERGVPLVIAENYRFMSFMRLAKEKIDSGLIGNIQSIDVYFARMHHMENYHKDLAEPLLMDVAIHHLDAMRYLTGEECELQFGETYNPSWSHYEGNANVNLYLKTEKGVRISYRGTLVSRFPDQYSSWLADWTIQGDKGYIQIKGDEMSYQLLDGDLIKLDGGTDFDGRKALLTEFLSSIAEKRTAETDITDNIKTFNLAAAVLE